MKKKPKILRCPKCGHVISIGDVAAAMGTKGGSATGPSKARTSEQASSAAKARWAKHKESGTKKSKKPI